MQCRCFWNFIFHTLQQCNTFSSTFQFTEYDVFPNCLQLIKFGTIKSAADCGKSSNTIQVPVLICNMHIMFAAGLDLVDRYRIYVSQITTVMFQLS